MSYDIDDALNLGGKRQPYALRKESMIVEFPQRGRTLYEEDHYDNQYDSKGNLIGRSVLSYYFQAGTISDSTRGSYVYKYR